MNKNEPIEPERPAVSGAVTGSVNHGEEPRVERKVSAERSGGPCQFGDLACGQGYWDCGKCRTKRRARAYRNLTAEQKAYDQYVDPMGAYHTDFPVGCSCHINPPCSFCTEGGAERRGEDGESESGAGSQNVAGERQAPTQSQKPNENPKT
jgi:ribosomal protein L37AE/L43A